MITNGRPDWDGGPRLRELRLVGFKSFAEATRLEFGPGISAIVGPNGSGKSNLADALRWALGEQGRSLRTRKSEDVIFAGSARRHATGMAAVSLVLGNDDRLLPVEYGLVECGRRLYRSGENEYLLNRQKVRLRDIVDLLDAANLADNAFLFIGQGMVDQALSLRPEERRPLFEEAAGVRRHERRRRQAEERLVEAEANLARVRDILGELRPQARRLAAQAEQQVARRDAGSELAEALVAAGRARWLAASRASQEADARLTAVRAEIDEAMRDLAAAEDAAATVARDMDDRAAAARTARDTLDEARSTVTEARLTIERLTEVRAGIERDTLRATDERAALDARMAAARRQLALPVPTPDRGAQAALAELDASLAAAVAELAGLEAAARADDERAASLRRARQAQEAELADLRRHADDAGQRLAEATAVADAAAARAAIDADALAAAQATLDAARGAEADAERETSEAAVAAERLQARSLAAAGRDGSTAERVDRLRARLAAIDAILDAGDRSGLVAAARRRGGRRLAEGLDVEPRFRPAVEAALGALIRAAVAGPDVALELRDEQGFVVLDDAAASGQAGRSGVAKLLAAVAEAGGGPLTDAIRRDPGGQVERLLATVAWVPDLAIAIGLHDRLPPGWRLVTERGEVVGANGVVQLGSPDATLERRAERERLAADLTAAEGEAAAASAEATDVGPRATAAREAHSAARARFDALRAECRRLEEVAAGAARAAEATGREAAWDRAQAERQSAQADRARAALADLVGQQRVAAPIERDDSTGTATHAAGQDPNDAADVWQARIGELRARRDAAADAWESADAERRQVEDARRRADVALSLDDARGQALERDAATRAVAAQRTDDELAAVLARRAVADDAEAAARANLAALETQAGDQRRRLVSLEADVVRHRDRLRREDEQARAAEVAELEGRLALDAARESLLVELAALGPVGLAALTTIDGVQAPPAVTDDDALAA
ncbi:MAG TPA: AAA family ATPase, partial [Candidatus Limnocylindrales bacterium]